MKRRLHAVLDTNVVLSALAFREGWLASLRMAWQSGRFEPLVDRAPASELVLVPAYPEFRLAPGEQEALLADYLPWCRVVATPKRPPAVPACRDPDDLPFLRLAVGGKADFVVTGDKALLEVGTRFACPIVTAQEFLRVVEGSAS